jgi:hypothetical protein
MITLTAEKENQEEKNHRNGDICGTDKKAILNFNHFCIFCVKYNVMEVRCREREARPP